MQEKKRRRAPIAPMKPVLGASRQHQSTQQARENVLAETEKRAREYEHKHRKEMERREKEKAKQKKRQQAQQEAYKKRKAKQLAKLRKKSGGRSVAVNPAAATTWAAVAASVALCAVIAVFAIQNTDSGAGKRLPNVTVVENAKTFDSPDSMRAAMLQHAQAKGSR